VNLCTKSVHIARDLDLKPFYNMTSADCNSSSTEVAQHCHSLDTYLEAAAPVDVSIFIPHLWKSYVVCIHVQQVYLEIDPRAVKYVHVKSSGQGYSNSSSPNTVID